MSWAKPPFKKDRNPEASGHRNSKDEKNDHQLPDKGISYFIEMLSSPDNIVFDPMVGTGEVLRVAKILNRKAIGIEIDS